MTLRRLTATGLGALAVLALASCGSDSDSDSSSASTAPAGADADAGLEVLAGPGIKFGETSYTVAAGSTTISYKNRDAQRHTLDIIDDSKTVIGSELVVSKNGDVDTGTYDLAPGTYTLECLVPGHDAMRAKLTVTG